MNHTRKKDTFLPEPSRKYGAKIYASANERFPYFIEGITLSEYGDREGCTEEEIKGLVDYNTHNGIRPWAGRILSWYDIVKSCPEQRNEIHDLVEELDWYLETMYGLKEMHEYPEWLQEYLYEEEENSDVSDFGTWMNILEKALPHLT